MDELRVSLLIATIKTLDTLDDYDMREAAKKELAKELEIATK